MSKVLGGGKALEGVEAQIVGNYTRWPILWEHGSMQYNTPRAMTVVFLVPFSWARSVPFLV